MTFHVDPEWWKGVFDELYLATDHRTVCDHRLTCREVDLIEALIPMDASSRILDLCGGHGRHCLELSSRGFSRVTCLDYSSHLLHYGRRCSRENAVAVDFVQADARNTGLKSMTFDAVLMMTNSFGYFADNRENLVILNEIYRLLKSNGYLLLDLLDPVFVRCSFKPASWHEVEPHLVVCRQRRLQDNIITARELVVSKREGLVRENRYCAQLFSDNAIRHLLSSAGFTRIDIDRGPAETDRNGDRGFMENRMFAVARKPNG